jgi:hypothetical protein
MKNHLLPSFGITANVTILVNTLSGTTFLATEVTEQTQCKGENRDHIKPIGDLHIPVKNTVSLMRELYEEIKHGDDEHQRWLKDAIESFIERKVK